MVNRTVSVLELPGKRIYYVSPYCGCLSLPFVFLASRPSQRDSILSLVRPRNQRESCEGRTPHVWARSPRYQVFFMAFRGLVRRSQWHCTPAHFSHSRRFTQSRPGWFPEWSKHLWAGCCPHHFHRKWIPAEKDWRRLSGLNSSIWHRLAGILVYFTNRSKSNKHAILIHRLMGLLLRDRRFKFQGAHVQWHQFLETLT